jgi:hypothetical protein
LPRPLLQRAGAWVAGAWFGVLLCLAALAAPAAFAILGKDMAGPLVGRFFAQEAGLSMGLGMLFVMGLRRLAGHDEDPPSRAGSDLRLWAALGVLFCTVAGYYVPQPMMAAARAGQGALSFGALHAISAGFFGLKMLLVGWLAWRLS